MSPTPEPETIEPGLDDGALPVEIEFKFGIEDRATIALLILDPPVGGIAGFAPSGPPLSSIEIDRYMDTGPASGALFTAGLRARLREGDQGVILAVKQRGVREGSVSTRVELEGPATRDLDPLAWPESRARTRLLDALAGVPPVEIAALRQRRLKRHFRRGDAEVELSLDDLEALDGDRIVGLRCEFEVELVSGPQDDLEELATALRALPGVGEPVESKLTFALSAMIEARRGPVAD